MDLIDRIAATRARGPRKDFAASSVGLSSSYSDGSHWQWPLGSFASSVSTAARERIGTSFESYVQKAFKESGVVAACITARMMPFSEARFQFQELLDGRPGRLFDDPVLELLDRPWANATTGDLLARMELNASLAGNFYATRVGTGTSRRVRILRPDWVTIISGVRGDDLASPWALNAEVLGYIYHPQNTGREEQAELILPAEMVHYAPLPDPEAQWRGMSWLTPVLREIDADKAATRHKLSFFETGATLGVTVAYSPDVSREDFERYVELFEKAHEGAHNAYKTLHLGGGADVKVVGADLKQLDFKATQGAGETRIAAAAGVGAIIARFSEGLSGSSLNSGNYSAAKRQFADMTLRPLWRSAAGSLEKFAPPPAGARRARLWYDDRDVEFLKEDQKDAAEILQTNASTVKQLVDAGYEPDAVIDAVEAGDLSRLTGKHSGLYSVQLQPPGSQSQLPTPQGGQP